MIKYIVFMFGLLLFSSCNENESESFITKEMKNYISNVSIRTNAPFTL